MYVVYSKILFFPRITYFYLTSLNMYIIGTHYTCMYFMLLMSANFPKCSNHYCECYYYLFYCIFCMINVQSIQTCRDMREQERKERERKRKKRESAVQWNNFQEHIFFCPCCFTLYLKPKPFIPLTQYQMATQYTHKHTATHIHHLTNLSYCMK